MSESERTVRRREEIEQRREKLAQLALWPAWALPEQRAMPEGQAGRVVLLANIEAPLPGWAASMAGEPLEYGPPEG